MTIAPQPMTANAAPDGLENRATPGPTYPNVAMSGP